MAENGTTIPHDPAATEETLAESKGKGKAVAPQDAAMDEDDDDEDEEDEDEDVEDDVCSLSASPCISEQAN